MMCRVRCFFSVPMVGCVGQGRVVPNWQVLQCPSGEMSGECSVKDGFESGDYSFVSGEPSDGSQVGGVEP